MIQQQFYKLNGFFVFVSYISVLIHLFEQDNNKKPNYVKISVESYSHLSGLEDQVKTYEEKVKSYDEKVQTYEEKVQTYEEKVQTLEDEIKEMNEKLSAANSEINTKEGMVKQHAKVAEEAVSGIIFNFFYRI